MFLIYINDIVDNIITYTLFADEFVVQGYEIDADADVLQLDLNTLAQ